MINANIKRARGGEWGLPLIIALKMNGITAVIRPKSRINQVINSPAITPRLENTSWNFSFCEANDVISELYILTLDLKRAAERYASAAARDQHSI
jgi:hypothetical protein